jgi:hypothetical protein
MAERPNGPRPSRPGPAGRRERRRARARPWSPHTHGSAAGAGSPTVSSGQGLRMEHRCGEWETLGMEGAGGAH